MTKLLLRSEKRSNLDFDLIVSYSIDSDQYT